MQAFQARLVRLSFATHRWLGVVLGLLMLMWCLSGFVLIWVQYPAMTADGRDLRTEGLAPLQISEPYVLPETIPETAPLTSLRIEMLADRPVAHLRWDDGSGVFDLESGQPIQSIGEQEALAIAETYAAQHGIAASPEIKSLIERDEFMVAGYFNSGRPYWQARLRDEAGTMLYIASTNGEIRQRTTTTLRIGNWLGAIPHWLYFTELRKNTQLWADVVIWTSLGGCFLVVLGGFVGIRQYRTRASTGRRDSPYRGAKYWHHMTGLFAGAVLLVWSFSGFTSMQPWGWLSTGSAAGEAAGRLPGDPPTWGAVRTIIENQRAAAMTEGAELKQMAAARFDGQMYVMWIDSEGRQQRRAPSGERADFGEDDWTTAGRLLAGEGQFDLKWMEEEDHYYYQGAAAGRLPVLRVTQQPDGTHYYINPETAQVAAIADDGAKGFRWLHLALHRVDFASWLRVRPVWDLAVLLLLVPATLISALGAWLGLRKLARGGKLDGPKL